MPRSGGGGLSGNELKDAIQIFQHVGCRNPHRAYPMLRQPSITRCIPPGGEIVRLAVDFDTQLRFVAVKVEDILTRRMLPPEAKPTLLLP